MKIGPVDIRNHTFQRKAMRGIEEAEIRAYLDLVADRLEEAIREAGEMRDLVDRANAEIREYRAMEKTLRDSLVSAERVGEERLSLAEREARLILKNAEVEGEKILAHARESGARYRAELEDLRRQRMTFFERFRALLSSQSKILEASAREFHAPEVDVPRTHEPSRFIEPPPIPPRSAEHSEASFSSYLGEEGLFATPPAGESRSEVPFGEGHRG
jgi:cell division initiation protein